jgi:hypothetical protein
LTEKEKKAKQLLQERKMAYLRVFDKDNVFLQAVLDDLETFCRGDRSCAQDNANLTYLLLGRQEVWFRIKNHLERSIEQLYEIHGEGKTK